MKPQRNTKAGKEDAEWEKIYSGAARQKISLCVLNLNSDFSLLLHGNPCICKDYAHLLTAPQTAGLRDLPSPIINCSFQVPDARPADSTGTQPKGVDSGDKSCTAFPRSPTANGFPKSRLALHRTGDSRWIALPSIREDFRSCPLGRNSFCTLQIVPRGNMPPCSYCRPLAHTNCRS